MPCHDHPTNLLSCSNSGVVTYKCVKVNFWVPSFPICFILLTSTVPLQEFSGQSGHLPRFHANTNMGTYGSPQKRPQELLHKTNITKRCIPACCACPSLSASKVTSSTYPLISKDPHPTSFQNRPRAHFHFHRFFLPASRTAPRGAAASAAAEGPRGPRRRPRRRGRCAAPGAPRARRGGRGPGARRRRLPRRGLEIGAGRAAVPGAEGRGGVPLVGRSLQTVQGVGVLLPWAEL